MSKFWMVWRVAIFLLWQISGILCAQNTALTTQIDYLIDKSDSFTYIKIDSALFYANAILQLGEQNHDATTTFRGYRTVASVYEENSRFAEAQAVYKKALDLAESQLSDFQKCTIYTDWAIIHKKMGQYFVTQDYHQRTIEKAQKINNWELVENGYNGLGTLQALLGDYEKAIQNYQKSIEAAEKWGNKTGVVLTYENIICLYLNTKNFLEAQKMVEKTRKIASTLGDEVRIAEVLNLEGNIDLALGRPYTALAKFKKVKDIFEKKGDKAQLSRTFLTIGNLYFEQKNNAEANEYFNQCLQNVDFLSPVCSVELYSKLGKLRFADNQTNAAIEAFCTSLQKSDALSLMELSRDNHFALADLFYKNKQPEKAYQHLLSANTLSDSMSVAALNKGMAFAQLKFDLELRDVQIQAQDLALKQSKWVRAILGSLLFLVLLLLFFVWRQMRAKIRATQHIELLMKELHHRVKNNLQTIASIMRLQARHVTDPSVAAVLAESRSRLEAISMIHQQLYHNQDVKSVNFKLFLNELIEKQLFANGLNTDVFESKITLENDSIDVEIAIPLGLIINELLTNSFKHAYLSVKNPKLSIEVGAQYFYYADNGKGLPSEFKTGDPQSFGVQLITSLAQQLRGNFQFGTREGMFFVMSY